MGHVDVLMNNSLAHKLITLESPLCQKRTVIHSLEVVLHDNYIQTYSEDHFSVNYSQRTYSLPLRCSHYIPGS